MRKLSLHIGSWITLVVLLFSISGVTVYSHKCLISGDVTYSFFAPDEDCCTKKVQKINSRQCCGSKKAEGKKSVKRKKSCCSESWFSKQLHVNGVSFWALALHLDVPPQPVGFFHGKNQFANPEVILPFSNAPPSLSGKSTLIRNCVFRI